MFSKTVAVIFLCALFNGFTNAKKESVDVPSEIIGLMTEKSIECVVETGAEIDTLQRVFQWQFDNNKSSKKFSFCLFKKAGFSDETGHFKIDKILELYEQSNKIDEVKDAALECEKIVEKNPVETMYKVINCFFDRSPVLLRVNLE